MILTDMYVAVKTVFVQIYHELFKKDEVSAGYLKTGIAAGVVLVVLLGGFYGYRFYTNKRESGAHKALSECIVEFENAKTGAAMWRDVQMALDLGYRQNSNSKLAPYFLTYKAESMQLQGKTTEAIETLESALKLMTNKDDFYGLYKAKLALMQLDSADAVMQAKGLADLQVIAESDNSGKDTALYYLGLYYFDKNDLQNTRKYWQQLVVDGEKENDRLVKAGLPIKLTNYVEIAKARLEQLQ